MTVLLFDVDGTLTEPMKSIDKSTVATLEDMKVKGYKLSVVGGSDYGKISSQLGESQKLFDYICTENGLVTYHNNMIITETLVKVIGESGLQEVINVILSELSKIILPVKRDRFIEVRTACINVSPIGRSCSYEERINFATYDAQHKVRERLISNLRHILDQHSLIAVIGGMISIDIYPKGWDKRYALKFFPMGQEIHFFGDKTEPEGNDHSIYNDPRVIGHAVVNPEHLRQLLLKI